MKELTIRYCLYYLYDRVYDGLYVNLHVRISESAFAALMDWESEVDIAPENLILAGLTFEKTTAKFLDGNMFDCKRILKTTTDHFRSNFPELKELVAEHIMDLEDQDEN